MPDKILESEAVAQLTKGFTLNQWRAWKKVSAMIEEAEKRAAEGGKREALWGAFQHVQGSITPDMILNLIKNAVEKGDAQTLKVLAQLGGVDLEAAAQAKEANAVKVIMFVECDEEKNGAARKNSFGRSGRGARAGLPKTA